MPIIPKGTKPGDVLQVPFAGMDERAREEAREQPDYYRRYADEFNPTYDPLSANTVEFQIEQTPGWELLSPAERRLTKGFIEGMGSATRRASEFFAGATRSISNSEAFAAASKVPVLNLLPYYLSKAVQVAMAATDAGAEFPERVGGMISQWAYARANGTEAEFTKNLGHAWQASSFYYNTLPAAFDPEIDGIDNVPLEQYGYGPEQLTQVRKYLDQGMSFDQINGQLMKDMGALYYRGTLVDLGMHVVFDLTWVTGLAGLKPMTLIQKGRAAILGGITTQALIDATALSKKLGMAVTKTYRGAGDIATAASKAAVTGAEELGTIAKWDQLALRGTLARDLAGDGPVRQWLNAVKEWAGEDKLPAGILPAEMTIGQLEEQLVRYATKADDLTPDEIFLAARSLQAIEDISAEMVVHARAFAEKLPKVWDQLSEWQRKFINFTGGMGLALKTADEALEWLNDGAKFYKPWTWFRLTPESKAIELNHLLRNDLIARMRGAKTIEEIRWRLGNPLRGLLDPRLGLQPFSVQGRSVIVALKHVGGKVDKMALEYGAGTPLRNALEDVAKLVYPNEPVRGVNMLVGALEDVSTRQKVIRTLTSLGKEAELAAIAKKAEIPYKKVDNLIDRFRLEYITNNKAFSVKSFELQAIMEVEEGILQANMLMFGLKGDSFLNKLADAAKASQSLLFLRMNPTYPIRNAINNELTMMIRGLWNAMGPEQIEKLWAKYGFDVLPSRLKEGLGPAEVALAGVTRETALAMGFGDATEQAKKLIRAIKGGDAGAMDKVIRTLRSSKLKDFGYLAAMVERSASQRAYTAGFLHFMQQTWVPGVGYDTFERFAKFSGWTPGGLSRDVMHSIESQLRGVTTAEGVDEVMRGAKAVDLPGALDDVARRFGKSGEELRDILGPEYIQKLQSIVDDAGTDLGKLDEGLGKLQGDLETHLRALQVEHAKKIMDEVEAAAKAGDASSLVQVMADAQGEMHALTMGYLSDMTERVHRIRGIADAGERAAAWKAFARENNVMFDGAIANMRGRLEGAYRAAQHLGAPVDEKSIRGLDDLRVALQTWNEEKASAWQRFFRATKNGEVDSQKAMAMTVDTLERSYKKFTNKALAAQREADAAWLALVKWGAPHMHAQGQAGREVVLELRKLYHAAVVDNFRQLEKIREPADRMAFQDLFTKARAEWMNRINIAEQETSLSVIRQTGWGTNLTGVDEYMLRIYNAKRHPPVAGVAANDLMIPNFVAHKKRFLQMFPGHNKETNEEILASKDWLKYVNQIETQASQGLGNLHGRMETRLSRMGDVNGQYVRANQAIKEASLDGLSPEKAVAAGLAQVNGRADRVRYLEHLGVEAGDEDVARAVRASLTAEWRAATPDELGVAGKKGLVQNGQYASVSGERGVLSAEENAEATARLEARLRELGYDPIPTKGGYTYEGEAGAQGVSAEATFLVPGMDSRAAFMIGEEFGQEGVFLGGRGTLNIATGRLDTHDFGEGLIWWDMKSPPDLLPPGWTEIEVGSQRMAFSAPMTGQRVPWVAEMDGPDGLVSIIRYHNKSGFTNMSPQNAAHYTGVPQARSTSRVIGIEEPRVLDYYIDGAKAEDLVVGSNRVRYATQIEAKKIYDIGVDAKNYAGRFIKPGEKLTEGKLAGLMTNPESRVLAALKRDGFMGYRNTMGAEPNTVRVWDDLTVEEIVPPGAPDGALSSLKGAGEPQRVGPTWMKWARDNQLHGSRAWRANPNATKGSTPIGTEIGLAMQKHFKISPEEARVYQVLTDGRARRWAQRTGGTVDDYYKQYLSAIDEGFPELWKWVHQEKNPHGHVIAGAMFAREDGQAVISALQNPDFATGLHELIHAWRQDMSIDELAIIERAAGLQAPAYMKLLVERRTWAAVPDLKGHDDLIDLLHSYRNAHIEWMGARIDRTHTRSLAAQSRAEALRRSLDDWGAQSPENAALLAKIEKDISDGKIYGVHSTPLAHLGTVVPAGKQSTNLRLSDGGNVPLKLSYESWWKPDFLDERWVKNVMSYFQEGAIAGKGQTELQHVFESLKTWLGGVYKDSLTGSHRGLKPLDMNPELKAMLDDMFQGIVNQVDEAPTPKMGIPVPEQKQMFGTNPSLGRGLEELWWTDGRKMMSNIGEELRTRARTPGKFKPELGNLDPQARRFLNSYGEHVKGQLNDTINQGMRWGEWRRDATLLNYNRRTYFDQALGYAMPFGFWTTHYMWNTMVHAFDRPQFMATMYRLNKYQAAVGQSMPQRFRNHLPIGRNPWMPEWMGKAYVNLLGSALPFNFWEQGGRDMEDSGRRVMSAAARILQEQMQAGQITPEQYRDAINFRTSAEWKAALDKAQQTGNEPDPMEEMQTFLSPHAPMVWAWHLARRTTDHIGPFLPVTRTIKGLSAVLGFGPPGGINIEGWFRDKIGLPKFDRFDDYRVDRMLSNMVGDGTLTLEAAQRAMIERTGPDFELAQKRAGQEFGISALTGAMFPVRIYPQGEEVMLSLVAKMNAAYAADKKQFPDGSLSPRADEFWDEHPEVAARLAVFKGPEERMNQFLADQIWQKWNDANSLDRDILKAAMGQDFVDLFLSKDTRDIEGIPPEKLAIWLNMMGGDAPGTLGSGVAAVRRPPPEIGERVEAFYDERRAQFGDMSGLWDTYFKLDKPAQRKFWRAHPILNGYVKWREQWLLRNPSVVPYLVEKEEDRPNYSSPEAAQAAERNEPAFTPQEYQTMMTPSAWRLIGDYVEFGIPLPASMVQYLDDLAEKLGTTRAKILLQLRG